MPFLWLFFVFYLYFLWLFDAGALPISDSIGQYRTVNKLEYILHFLTFRPVNNIILETGRPVLLLCK